VTRRNHSNKEHIWPFLGFVAAILLVIFAISYFLVSLNNCNDINGELLKNAWGGYSCVVRP
jgi:hypothetical protein